MKLIIFTGPPASGKSSFASAVGEYFHLPVVSKDAIKVQLFESFGFSSHAEKKNLSMKSLEIMYEQIIQCLKSGNDVVVDNNFKSFREMDSLLKSARVSPEVYCVLCTADCGLLAKRYNERIRSGKRPTALYTINRYPVVPGVSEFHPDITVEDVARIQQEVTEETYGRQILRLETDNIETGFPVMFCTVCNFIGDCE